MRGLVDVADPRSVTVVGNVGDDLDVLGMRVSPDLDSILYALAGLNDESRGWGRADESWNALATVTELGGESWFALGDRDLGLHLVRTQALARRRATLHGDGAHRACARRRDGAAACDRRCAAHVDRDRRRRVHVPGVVRRARTPRRSRCPSVRRSRGGDARARPSRRDRVGGSPADRAQQSLRLDRADSRRAGDSLGARQPSRSLRRGQPADRRARGEGPGRPDARAARGRHVSPRM